MNANGWAADFLQASPMFEPLRPAGAGLEKLDDWPAIGDLEQLRENAVRPLVAKSGRPLRFVPQSAATREFAQQYEPRIYLAGEVQTRAQNWHDLFNALAWIAFPRAKAALNRLHYQSLLQERALGTTRRGAARDRATLFDESGVAVVSSDAQLIELLRNFEWKELFWQKRQAVLVRMKVFLFGHGLCEKALKPYLGMTGKGIILPVEEDYFSQPLPAQLAIADRMLDDLLSGGGFAHAGLTPVPVLGYPGWSPDNADAAYYGNRDYFRPRRVQAAAT